MKLSSQGLIQSDFKLLRLAPKWSYVSQHPLLSNSLTTLSAIEMGDLCAIQAVFDHVEVARMTHSIKSPFGVDDAREFIVNAINPYLKGGLKWAIRVNNELIGVISLNTASQNAGLADMCFGPSLGISLNPKAQNKGYGSASLSMLLEWASNHSLIKAIHAAHFADNAASSHLLTKAGFLYTGRQTLETSLGRSSGALVKHMLIVL